MSVRYKASVWRTTVKFVSGNALADALRPFKNRKVFIVDRKVWGLYETELKALIGNDPLFLIDAVENKKNLVTFTELLGFLAQHNIVRGDYIIAFGGGITLDIAGFAASVFKRGCRLVFIPTTFVAMIDASVGGKNGINYEIDEGSDTLVKNLIGNFYPPDYTLIHERFLNTLTPEDLLNGWAEAIKVSLLLPNKLYINIIRYLKKEAEAPPIPSKSIIRDAITLKEKLCRNDLYDRSQRRKLNLGHTIAHLIETASAFELSHGIAVSLGIRAVAKMSLSAGRIDNTNYCKIIRPFDMLGFPHKVPERFIPRITENADNILKFDKKKAKQIKIVVFADFQNCRIIGIDDVNLLLKSLIEM